MRRSFSLSLFVSRSELTRVIASTWSHNLVKNTIGAMQVEFINYERKISYALS